MIRKISSGNLVFLFALLIIFISATCTRREPEKQGFGFPKTLIPNGIGVNIHFRGAPEKDLELLKDAHIKLIRADLTWAGVEREKHNYDFTGYDELVLSMERQGARILFILDYKNRLYGKEKSISTDMQRKAFANYAAEAAKHYKGRGVIWEIWNEPNIAKFWGDEPDPNDYMKLLSVTCKAIRKTDPSSIIVAPATVGCDRGFIENCAKEGLFELVDGISVHPYREGGPESVVKCYEGLRKLMNKYVPPGRVKPKMVSSEWGWGLTYLDLENLGTRHAEIKQAEYLTRRFCIEAYAGVVCAIHYKWRENNHGLIRSNYKLKPAYTAFKVLNEQLTGYGNTISRLEIGDKETNFLFIFKGPKGKKLVAWRTEGKETVSIPFRIKKAKAVDFLGRTIGFEMKDKSVALELTEQPVFIEY